ncbi:MAG TPA: hypothetical protein PKA63_04580 [Oligoflexia bacterium]|nr:hypothetical protein [Oligoflexia bacterium]HMP47926.1 hypothetical protein [Oligoflexia bacterium]
MINHDLIDLKRFSRQIILRGWSLKRQVAISKKSILYDVNMPSCLWYALALGVQKILLIEKSKINKKLAASLIEFNPRLLIQSIKSVDYTENKDPLWICSQNFSSIEELPDNIKVRTELLLFVNLDDLSGIKLIIKSEDNFSEVKVPLPPLPYCVPVDHFMGIFLVETITSYCCDYL